MRPRLLDLFAGAGGAAVGYARAGFDVVGVDTDRRQLEQYPFRSIRMDAVAALTGGVDLDEFDVVHASPPCQAYVGLARGQHPDLIPAVQTRPRPAGARHCSGRRGADRCRRNRDVALAWMSSLLGHEIEHTSTLNRAETSILLDELKSLTGRATRTTPAQPVDDQWTVDPGTGEVTINVGDGEQS